MSSTTLVSKVMAHTTVSVVPSTTLRDVAEIMVREGIGAVVVRGQEGPAGVITERDLVQAIDEEVDMRVERASDAMTYDVEAASPDEDMSTAATRLVEGGIRHLPVVENDEVVGMISIKDVLASLV